MLNNAKKLRQLLLGKELILAPGVYDAFSARIVSETGFSAVYMSGACVAHSLLGKPDIGLTTLTEMTTAARNIVLAAGETPVIADADNGYGGLLNVMRTVNEYECAGVACIQLEDQVFPKRCGHMEGKEVIPKDEMIAKIKAAIAAKNNPDTVIMARTDARAVTGFDDALDRAKAYAQAGADVIFFEAPQSVDEMREINQALNVPLLVNMVEMGKTPLMSKQELEEIGYKIAIYPGTVMMAVSKTIAQVSGQLLKQGTSSAFLDQLITFKEFNERIHLQELRDMEKSFLK
ncbi:isocitrate lyase/PEP mutase family protein [Lacrimispora sp.]|uniref:isocitrate lyase/PEP mutase family protein n=1 Tax=Lacrimispora sp. TaxID=2719234 RepID=UPI00289A0355|nr:oxaloacetate decarboxylase [Lacrimispora sp.]